MTITSARYLSGSSSESSYGSSSGSSTEEETRKTRLTAYERVRAIYTRDGTEILSQKTFGWSPPADFSARIFDNATCQIEKDVVVKSVGDEELAYESSRDNGIWVGIIANTVAEASGFDEWFLTLLARTTKATYPSPCNPCYSNLTQEITLIFVRDLKNTTPGDKWEASGEQYFEATIDYFTSRNVPIEAVLPAFPHKSSNLDKVSSPMPDKGEELALRRLIFFADSIEKIYPPGVRIWIVSDGHVFSDCVGVDDNIVGEYFFKLYQLYLSVKPLDKNPIRFHSLVDIFSLKTSNFDTTLVDGVVLNHYLDTEIDLESELCRKILEASCDTDCGALRRDIHTPDHPRLYLYRGFARFMEEDLAMHPIVRGSRKRFKKIVSKVAFEMIKRNDAYSNLVELVFPFHVRFSIHAHKNSGPKFGIQLLKSLECNVIQDLDDYETPALSDLLHIPTPWHNAIAQIDGKKMYYVIKSGCIRHGLSNGKVTGGWNAQMQQFDIFTNN